jgi:hypothetical protein
MTYSGASWPPPGRAGSLCCTGLALSIERQCSDGQRHKDEDDDHFLFIHLRLSLKERGERETLFSAHPCFFLSNFLLCYGRCIQKL